MDLTILILGLAAIRWWEMIGSRKWQLAIGNGAKVQRAEGGAEGEEVKSSKARRRLMEDSSLTVVAVANHDTAVNNACFTFIKAPLPREQRVKLRKNVW